VSALNAGGERGIIGPCFNPASVVAAVLVRDLAGGVLFRGRSERMSAGTGAFVDVVLHGRTAAGVPTPGPALSRRHQVRAEVVLLVEEDPAQITCGVIAPTLEVFDIATGSTVFTMPFVAVAGVEPQPF
jgi:hypothetical protein